MRVGAYVCRKSAARRELVCCAKTLVSSRVKGIKVPKFFQRKAKLDALNVTLDICCSVCISAAPHRSPSPTNFQADVGPGTCPHRQNHVLFTKQSKSMCRTFFATACFFSYVKHGLGCSAHLALSTLIVVPTIDIGSSTSKLFLFCSASSLRVSFPFATVRT